MIINPTTLFLLQIFGPILLVIGVSVHLHPDQYKKMLKSLKPGTAEWYLISILPLSLGIVLVLVHNQWNTLPEILVSLIGWGALIKGVLRLLAPATCMDMLARVVKSDWLSWCAIIILTLGAYMSWVGYMI